MRSCICTCVLVPVRMRVCRSCSPLDCQQAWRDKAWPTRQKQRMTEPTGMEDKCALRKAARVMTGQTLTVCNETTCGYCLKWSCSGCSYHLKVYDFPLNTILPQSSQLFCLPAVQNTHLHFKVCNTFRFTFYFSPFSAKLVEKKKGKKQSLEVYPSNVNHHSRSS